MPPPQNAARLRIEPFEERLTPADAGTLDPAFGVSGRVAAVPFDPPGSTAAFTAAAVQPDGRVVLAGHVTATGNRDFAVARLTTDGKLDPSFGAGGRVTVPFDLGGDKADTALAVAVQPDGRIVVAGGANRDSPYAFGGASDFAVARLNADGSLDPTFDGDGRAAVRFADAVAGAVASRTAAAAVGVRSDGRITLVGQENAGARVARLTAAGQPDPAYGTGGKLDIGSTAPQLGRTSSAYTGFDVLPDGAVLAAGGSDTLNTIGRPPQSDLFVTRLAAGGTPDAGFGEDGTVSLSAEGFNRFPVVAGLPDGRVVVAGQGADAAGVVRLKAYRLRADGTPDPAFGTAGRADVPFSLASADQTVTAVEVAPDGRVVLGALTKVLAGDGVAVARLTAAGALDPAFGPGGVAVVPGRAMPAAVEPDGDVLLAGASATGEAAAARLLGQATPGPGVPTIAPRAPARSLGVGGRPDGTAAVYAPGAGGSLQPGSPLALFPGTGLTVRTATADVNADGVADTIAGAGPGAVTRVVVTDGKTGATLAAFQPFEAAFTGGVFVAAADLTGDSAAEVIVTPDQGGGPVVAVYDGAKLAAAAAGDAAQLIRFFGIEDAAFRGGARPAAGDVTRDGVPDLVIAAGFLGGPRVTVWSGQSVRSLAPAAVANFFAFEQTLRNGVFVAAADFNQDGRAELVFGGGPGGGPRVLGVDAARVVAGDAAGAIASPLLNFFAGDAASRGGVRLAAADADGDGRADLATGSGDDQPSRVRVYRGSAVPSPSGVEPPLVQEFDPFGAVLATGVFVG